MLVIIIYALKQHLSDHSLYFHNQDNIFYSFIYSSLLQELGQVNPQYKNSSFEQHVIVCITDKIFIIYLQTVIQIHFRCCNCCTRDTFQMCLKLICIDLEKSVILLTVKSCTQLQSYRRSFHSNNIPYYYYYIATSK